MVSQKVAAAAANIRRFVCGQLRHEPDLSTLTLRILKKRYLALVGQESLSAEARSYMKQVVEEELMKMQDSDEDGDELETKKPQNKRKREKENDEVISGREDEDGSRAKKSRRQLSSSSESEDEERCKTASEESAEEEPLKSESEEAAQEVKKSKPKTNGKARKDREDSSDEEVNESEKKGDESNGGDSPGEMGESKEDATKNGESPGKKTPESDEESETVADKNKINGNESSDNSGKGEKVAVEKKNDDDADSDSSSLPSLDDEKESGQGNKQDDDDNKKKTLKKEENKKKESSGQKDDNRTVVRLKRYIALCGVKRNYKKLLEGCRSVRSMVAVLKKELEDLGVDGNPSIKKCKKIKMKREEDKELAELDASNIIVTQGRPKRRGALAKQDPDDPPSSAYKRTLNSGSDSDQENEASKGHRRTTDWANLQGIISDDADSD